MKSDPADLDALDEQLFPRELAIASADAVATYSMLTARFGVAGFAENMLSAHARSLASPELNALFRSPSAIEDVEQAGAEFGPRLGMEPAAAGAAAVAKYKRGCAEQLATTKHKLAPVARRYLDALAARDATDAEAAAQAERERAEREAAEAAEREAKRQEAERAAAELARAAAESQTLEARLRATRAEHRRLREQYFVAACRQLKDSGVSTIRLREGFGALFGRGAYGVDDLIAGAPGFADETLARFERAVSDELERLEDAEA